MGAGKPQIPQNFDPPLGRARDTRSQPTYCAGNGDVESCAGRSGTRTVPSSSWRDISHLDGYGISQAEARAI
jgi:hypothetical protein